MDEHAVWSTFEAKPGKEPEVEAFLRECCAAIGSGEPGTTAFFALRLGPGRYATFDTMRDDAALDAHVNGPTANAVRARAAELFEGGPEIVKATVLAAKAPDRS